MGDGKVRKIEESVERLILTLNNFALDVLFKSQPPQDFQLSEELISRTFSGTMSYSEEEALKVARRQAVGCCQVVVGQSCDGS